MSNDCGSIRSMFGKKGMVLLLIAVVSAATLFSAISVSAQVENGITGTVMDPTGALIAGASLTVTDIATGVVAHARTSSAGTFRVVGLEPGHYSVAVEAPGFKRSIETDVIVEVAKMSTVSFTMVPGSATTSIHVTANAIALNTTAPQIGTTLEPELVATAPIEISGGLARQLDSFMYLAPGVQGNAGSHNIDGGLTYENEVQFNGVPVAFVQFEGVQTNINPPYEMVNEFRVNSATFDATYGLGQGAVTYNLASGTNQLHGDAFDILRNQLFDSVGFFPTYFTPSGRPAPPVDQQNDYGFTVSGPVMLPKLYDGRNRTFFLFSSDWSRFNEAQKQIGTVPTAAMKNGDFSGFVDSNGNQIPIYDPTTGQPFPGNVIPSTRFSAIAKTVLPYIPNPNRAGVNFGLQENESPAVPAVAIRQHLWGYTLDHTLTQSQSIHFSQWRDALTNPSFTTAPIVPVSNELQSEITDSEIGSGFVLNYQKTMSNNLVATVGADWIGELSRTFDANQHVSFPGVVGGTTFPLIYFGGQNAPTQWGVSGSGNLGGLGAGFQQNNNRQLGIVLVNNWLWSKGRNTINFGGQFRRTYEDLLSCSFCSGVFEFNNRTTSIPNSNDPNSGVYGSGFASFLLGLVDGGNRASTNTTRLRNKAFAVYAQDDIKVTPRFTADVGLRWDVLVPFTEEHNYVVYIDNLRPTVLDPGAGNLPGGASKFGNCAGCSGYTRADIDWKTLQPRLGISYSVTPKTVIQSGFFLTYLDGGAYEYGSEQTAFYFASLLGGEFLRQPNGSSNPAYGSWDGNPLPDPPPTPFSPSIGNGNVIMAFNPRKGGRPPYDEAWNLGVQRQLPWNMFAMVAYTGNRAIHLPSSIHQPEQPNPSVLQYGSLLGELADSPDAQAAGIKVPYPGWEAQFNNTGTVLQALLPFPQYSDIYNTYETEGTSFYNGIQMQGEKRFSNGLSYLADLTVSRTISDEAVGATLFQPNPINSYNIKPEFTPSFRDQKYLVNIVATYALPTGPGKRYFNSQGVLGQVLGGWQVSGILSYAGGYPFGAYNGYNPLYANFGDRPDKLPGVALKTYSYKLSKEYFTGKSAAQPVQFPTNAFQNTGPWQLGNAVATYSSLRTPPLRIENFDAIKTFSIAERVKATLRVDYFNAFNRTQLEGPDNNSLDSTFGQITNLSSQISNRQGQATFRIDF